MKIAYKNTNTNSMEVTGLAGNTPYIGTNGNWYIGTVDTGVSASNKLSFNPWASTTPYVLDDYVVYDNKLYKCTSAHTSSTDFTTDITNWTLVIGNDGGGISFEDWKAATEYAVNDYVIYDNKLYICKVNHTSDTDFTTDIANWDLIIGVDFSTDTDGNLQLNSADIKVKNSEYVNGKKIVELTDSEYETMINNGEEEEDVIYIISDGTKSVSNSLLSASGYGGVRCYGGKLQYYDDTTSSWVDVIFTGTNYYIMNMTPQPMQNVEAISDPDNAAIKLRWTEPSDTVIDGQLACYVSGVMIRRSTTGYPTGPADGELVANILRKDFGKYKKSYYVDAIDNIANETTYYYNFFPYNDMGDNNLFYNANDNNKVSILYREYHLYGFVFDTNESDPFSNITYIEDNEKFASAKMDYNTGLFNYGDWEDVWFIKNCKPCMLKYDGTVDYYLDKNNYTLREDGTASDIADTNYGGNVMVGIPTVYYKVVDNGDDTYNFYFSDKKVDNDYKCYAHLDANGNVMPYMYMAAYQGANVSSVLRSISGTTNIYGQTAITEISYANANNTAGSVSNIWYTELYSDRQLINMLLILIGKSTDTQTVFGNGNIYFENVAGEANIVNTNFTKAGTMNQKGLFWGSNSTTEHIGVKVFGIENFWSNQWRRVAGLVNDNGTQKIKLTYGQQDGSTVDGYNTDGTGYITVAGATPTGTSGGYISKCTVSEYGIIPYEASGSATTYECDGFWYNNSQIDYLIVGGDCTNKSFGGAFTWNIGNLCSLGVWICGTSLSCKPLVS